MDLGNYLLAEIEKIKALFRDSKTPASCSISAISTYMEWNEHSSTDLRIELKPWVDAGYLEASDINHICSLISYYDEWREKTIKAKRFDAIKEALQD